MVVATMGCEDARQSLGVATVEGVDVSSARFGEWFTAIPGAEQFGPASVVSGSPDFNRCIMVNRQHLPPRAVMSEHQLKGACAQGFAAVKAEAVRLAITDEWLRQEAHTRDAGVSLAKVDREIVEVQESFPSLKAFRRYLSGIGLTTDQLRRRIGRDLLARQLMREIVAPDLTVSAHEVAHYYRGHKREFAMPPSRDVQAVVAKTRRRALEARAALGRGQDWDEAVREYSQDLSKRNGGRMTIGKDNAIKRLRDAVFGAERGELVGPIYIRPVWWVFTVGTSVPSRQLPLHEVRGRIRTIIRSTRESRALDKLTAYLMRTYRPKTVCSPGFDARECRNRPRSQPLLVPR